MAEGVTVHDTGTVAHDLASADLARSRGDDAGALAGYKAALFVTPDDDRRTRASIYVRIGEIKRATGKPREAELNFEKAVRADPTSRAALDQLVELAIESGEARRAVDWRRKRLDSIQTYSERISELRAIAETCAEKLGDRDGAVAALEEAYELDSSDPSMVRSVCAAYERIGGWQRVCEILVKAADAEKDTERRGALRIEAANVAFVRLNDDERGLAILAKTLDENPAHDEALKRLIAARTARGEWELLDALYSKQIERLAALGEEDRAYDACRKLGTFRRDRLRDAPRAIEAFSRALRVRPSDVDTRAMLADMHLANGDEAAAIAEFEAIATQAPMRASTYARLFSLHKRAGRIDRAWLVGCAIEELGMADLSAQLVVDQYRVPDPIRPSRALSDADWDSCLRAPAPHPAVADILRAIGPAAAAARIEGLREARQLLKFDASARQGESSTVSAVRSMRWAAHILGIEAPEIYVIDDVPGGVAAVPAAVPTTVLGPAVLSGLSPKELAFVTARHLTYYRPEHYALIFYPTQSELFVLLLAAARVVLKDTPVPSALANAVELTRRLLARAIGKEARERLESAAREVSSGTGVVDLAAWIRSVELTAQRSGLFLCGDLVTATTHLRSETRAIADLTLEERRADLLAFSASPHLARARALAGVDIQPRPGATASASSPP
ncbi:MAG: tetratricopeptide repeat protein [Polyangiaceae bacterium]|jgi:tetratricopeptide (TPR) repeat protein